MCHKSPAKVLRNVKRIALFLEKKSKSLSVSVLPQVNISPIAKPLDFSPLVTTNVPPEEKPLNVLMHPVKNLPKLSYVKAQSTSISPRTVYHPCIINASEAMFRKHPEKLTPEENLKFQLYQQHKIRIGIPLETEVIYLPIGGIRMCVNCRELT